MTVKHHLNEQLLMGYAAGILPEAFNLVIATQMSISDEARARLASYESIGGGILEQTDQAEMNSGAFQEVLTKISKAKPKTEAEPMLEGVFPKPLQEYVGGDLDAVKWKNLGRGVRQAILKTDGKASARLLYIPAGMAMPDHGHNGLEMTLVLQGAFFDDEDRFARGDIEIGDEDMDHTPTADDSGPCICLAATDAPLKFKGILPRMLQPIFKI
jgi:putative transcriptional regulator